MNNGGIEVVKKVNLNFGSLKLNDSKKRLRSPAPCGMNDDISNHSDQ